MLDRTRDLKMARSVHAFVRGSTKQFYIWIAEGRLAIPEGPPVWICADCHLGNLGPLADADGRIDIQIRDLDQTVIGNPALDVVRLGLSLETAARSSDLPGVTTAHMIAAVADGYARALTPAPTDDPLEPEVVHAVRKEAKGRSWRHLAKERIDGTEPDIPLGKRFWKLTDEERDAIDALFADPAVAEAAHTLEGIGAKGRIRVVDAAYWRKGCSSLGRMRFAVLLGLRDEKGAPERLALIDIKEAVASVAPAYPDAAMPQDPADRVVAGARALAPNLGYRMIPARLLGKPVVLRELAPQDLKIEVEQFSQKEAVRAAQYLAYVLGMAHARQLSVDQRQKWVKAFRTRDPRDAPDWLWQAIVTLAGQHEAGYLDYCRTYAKTES